ncbi:hypothetical protein C8024_00895 [Sphingopyxis sp. BSNA05]|nr:hypothetical protein [Sphingopyxis sp. BSNA05]
MHPKRSAGAGTKWRTASGLFLAARGMAPKGLKGPGEETEQRAVASDAAPARVPERKGQGDNGHSAKGNRKDLHETNAPAKPT